jgi:hypothetical protein
MKKYSLWVIILFSIGCHEHADQVSKTPISGTEKPCVIRLVDSLGIITISIPNRYDTFFAWVNHSDCGKPCDRQMYRYQPERMPVQMESGFFPPPPLTDSVDEITISHSSWFHFLRTDSGINLGRHKSLEDHSRIESGDMKLFRDSLFAVDGRNFSVFARERSDSVFGRYVLATTSFRGFEIEFEFRIVSKTKGPDEADFYKGAIDVLRTVRLELTPPPQQNR